MKSSSPMLIVTGALLIAATLPARCAGHEFNKFTTSYCLDCHDSETKKGGLDLSALTLDPTEAANFATWVKIHDYVATGEMPPKKKARPAAGDLKAFTNALETVLLKTDRTRLAKTGRTTQRRLNRYEYEETLRDLLSLPYLEAHAFLPEDREAHGFTKIGDALDVSHVQMGRYLAASDFALHEAMAPMVERPASTTQRYYTWEDDDFFGHIDLRGPLNRRTFPLIFTELQVGVMAEQNRKMPHTKDPVRREQEALAVVVSTYEPTEIRFSNFRAPVTGRYRLRLSGYSVWMAADYRSTARARRSEPVTVYAETPPRSMRRLGSFDVGPDPTVGSMDVWLLAGETIRPDAARLFRSRPPDHENPLATKEGMPAVAFQWLEIEGPVIERWPPASHELLFGNLPMKNREQPAPEPETGRRRRPKFIPPPGVDVTSAQPGQDAEKLLRNFMEHVYRRPVQKADLKLFLALIKKALATGSSFTDAMLTGYSAVLSSPAFLYLDEKPGRLDDRALAARLSYFLWNSRPDETLQTLASQGELQRPEILRQQTERLLNDPRSRRFVNAFLDYWLDLRLISGTAPDEQLYPEYQLDDLLADSMGEESQLFFSELLRRDLPARHLVASDFVELLQEHRPDFTAFSGVSHPDVDGGHPADNCFLTAAPHPGSGGFRNTISLDQYIGERLGHLTRFPSLTLGVNVQRGQRSLSWTSSGVLIPCEEKASDVFRRMFMHGSEQEITQQVRKLELGESILDTLAAQTKSLQRKVGAHDRERLDQYFTSVRDLEQRLAMSREWEHKAKPTTSVSVPLDPESPRAYMDKVELMYDMARLAFETDSTRSISLLLDSVNSPALEFGGVKTSDGYHNLSHHGKTEAKLSQLQAIDEMHMKLLGKLYGQLKATKEDGAPLLDRTMILYGTNLGNANTHVTTNLPTIFAGGGFQHGQHLAFDRDRNYPLPNLFVSMLQRMGIETDRFASSTGTFRGLETA